MPKYVGQDVYTQPPTACRFCGSGDAVSKQRSVSNDSQPRHYVLCCTCWACGPLAHRRDLAVQAWNWSAPLEVVDVEWTTDESSFVCPRTKKSTAGSPDPYAKLALLDQHCPGHDHRQKISRTASEPPKGNNAP